MLQHQWFLPSLCLCELLKYPSIVRNILQTLRMSYLIVEHTDGDTMANEEEKSRWSQGQEVQAVLQGRALPSLW